MKVNLLRAIKSITDEIAFLQPLYEAIVNAFQAGATEIDIDFEKDELNYIIGYTVKDNGEGFTDKNIDSFLELWSDHKLKIGGLGSGRILCLKVFYNVIIESQTKDIDTKLGQYVSIDFNRHFNKNEVKDIPKQEKASEISYTVTRFKNINKDYMKFLERCDLKKEKIEKGNISRLYNAESIKDNIFINLLPLFIRLREETIFSINIDKKLIFDQTMINSLFNDHKFEKRSFLIEKVVEDIDIKEEFVLTYKIEKSSEQKQIEQFYGASDRKVTKFPNDTGLLSLPEGYNGIFCLTSNYFTDKIKDSRAGFTIKADQNNPTIDIPIVFSEINEKLRELLSDIIREKFPALEKEFKEEKEKLQYEYPYLSNYLDKYKQITMPSKDILDKARSEFNKKKASTEDKIKQFIEEIKSDKFNYNKYNTIREKFTEVGQEQLASYIAYRQTIIDMLMNISQASKKQFDEADIHNLFMEKGKTSKTLPNKYANNVWIFDDKFMSYTYAASDVTIQQIVKDVTGEDYANREITQLSHLNPSNS